LKTQDFFLSAFGKPLIGLLVRLIRSLFSTCRVRWAGEEHIRAAEAESGGYLLALWHEHALTGVAGYIDQPMGALVSPSRDGDYLSEVLLTIGAMPIRGSSRQGGKAARERIKRYVSNGVPIAISVDGPAGPRNLCKPGIVRLAQQTGLPILPGIAVAHKPWVLNTWDRLQIPKPFSKLLMYHGELFHVPADLGGRSFESWQTEVEERLQATAVLANEAFKHWGSYSKEAPRPKAGPPWARALVGRYDEADNSDVKEKQGS